MSVLTQTIEEYVLHSDGMERCPECGFVWNDTGEGHFHDCRYYLLDHEEEISSDDVLPNHLPARRPGRKAAALHRQPTRRIDVGA